MKLFIYSLNKRKSILCVLFLRTRPTKAPKSITQKFSIVQFMNRNFEKTDMDSCSPTAICLLHSLLACSTTWSWLCNLNHIVGNFVHNFVPFLHIQLCSDWTLSVHVSPPPTSHPIQVRMFSAIRIFYSHHILYFACQQALTLFISLEFEFFEAAYPLTGKAITNILI